MADRQDGTTSSGHCTGNGDGSLSAKIQGLPPDDQKSLQILVDNLQKGKAKLRRDNGNICVEDMESISYRATQDPTFANTIQTGKSDTVLRNKLESCIDLIDHLKQNKNPGGVILDSTKAKAIFGRYLEGEAFEKSGEKLGKGVCGDIVVVKDKKLDEEHAMKTMMISVFRKEEIRCWMDLNDSGFVPALYIFRLESNKVVMHMEILRKAKTLKEIIDEQMFYIRETDSSLVRPFALYVFHGLLSAVNQMNEKDWVHGDLHGGNVMLSDDVNIKVIDFGTAQSLGKETGINYESFQRDIQNIVGIFCGLYVSDELRYDEMISSTINFKNLWREKLEVQPLVQVMAPEEKEELFCLIDTAMQISGPLTRQKEQLMQSVQSKLDSYDMDNVLKKITNILFKKEIDDENIVALHESEESMGMDYPDTSVTTDSPKFKRCNSETFIDRLRKSMSIGGSGSTCDGKYASV